MTHLASVGHEAPGTLVLAADLVLPLGGADPIHRGAVAIRDGRVVAVGAASEVSRVHGVAWTNPGTTLMPGLVDAHDHLHGWRADPAPGSAAASVGSVADIAATEAARHLSRGVTLVRVLGTPHREDLALRGSSVAGGVRPPLPALVCAGRAITGPAGPSVMARMVHDADEGRRAVDDEVEHGADWVKVLLSLGIDAAGGGPMSQPTLEPEVLGAIVDRAHAHGRRVAAHAHGSAAIGAAVAAGVDSIEHGTGLTTDLARAMAAEGIPLVPTLVTYRRLATRGGEIGLPDAWRRRAAALLDDHTRSTTMALAEGVAVAAGSDGFGDLIDEIVALSTIGLGPLGALEASVAAGGHMVDPTSGQGSITSGVRANLVLVGGDVLADLGALRDVRMVLRDGRPVAIAGPDGSVSPPSG